MKIHLPMLKPAVQVNETIEGIHLTYRGQQLLLTNEAAGHFNALRAHLDGQWNLQALVTRVDIAPQELDWLLSQLEAAHMLVDGDSFSSQNGLVSAEHAFWLLEADLCRLKFSPPDFATSCDLEGMIARGEVRQEVAEGYLIELGYLLRQVPQELALAVATSAIERVRLIYVEFFQEECQHGEIIFDKLKTWIIPQQLLTMRPLPGTVAVLNMYRAFANDGSLAYAVALMHDESTPLDPPVQEDTDPYSGLRRHFTVPESVVSIFEWHTNLDRDCEHGFFPLEIFRCFGPLDRRTMESLRSKLLSLFETHAMWRRNILEYYSENTVFDRVGI